MTRSLQELIDIRLSHWQTLKDIVNREIELVWEEAHNPFFVYFMVDPETRKVKIGTTKDIEARYRKIHSMNSGGLILLYYEVYGDPWQAHERELYYHRRFADYRDYSPSHYERVDVRREWFHIEGELKCYLQQLYRRKLRLWQLRTQWGDEGNHNIIIIQHDSDSGAGTGPR